MGLDISVVKNLRRVDPQPDEEDEGSFIRIYLNPGFPGREDELTGGYYDGEHVTSFRAGSYSGYNQWRNILCQAVLGVHDRECWDNEEKYAGQPCVELICFSDCEGTIGPKTSAKLYQDFVANRQKFVDFIKVDDPNPTGDLMNNWDMRRYDEWTEAFKIASENNGAVCFH